MSEGEVGQSVSALPLILLPAMRAPYCLCRRPMPSAVLNTQARQAAAAVGVDVGNSRAAMVNASAARRPFDSMPR